MSNLDVTLLMFFGGGGVKCKNEKRKLMIRCLEGVKCNMIFVETLFH